ncbi:MAG: hypothetical protein A2V88_17355 [Elusimicrobia bacterium RBG_16_66_12]|nr:MAG: hypothetical protein A2V88_17355 [Elusimicrobia bacterium RBG_16_66_12]
MKLLLALTLIFHALPALADDAADSAVEKPGAAATAKKAHPDLLRLEQDLTRKLDEKNDGRVTPEQYQAWIGEFRACLDAAMARIPPLPDNTAAHARITAQLGEREQAQAALDQALEQNPKSPVLLRTKGHILFEQKDFPGAAHNALQAWENSGHTDQGAWALYQMSKGRSAPSGTASASPGLSPLTQGPPVVSVDDSNKPIKLAMKGSTLPSLVPTPGQDGDEPIKREGGLPLWPLAVPIAGGLIAYGLYRGTKKADSQESEQPAVGALLTAPGLIAEPANIAGGVIRTAAKGVAIKTLGDVAITGVVAAGILVVGGTAAIVTVNHGLNDMIAAQDKYNAEIDTHMPVQPIASKQDRSAALDKEAPASQEDECEDWKEKVRRLRKGMRSLQKRLDEHMGKTRNNPNSRDLNHWAVEIRAFSGNIQKNEAEAKRLEKLCGDK